ncbi:MAG: hypothetical protein ACYDCM_15890 [Candidatus Acidiferrales bacterium]
MQTKTNGWSFFCARITLHSICRVLCVVACILISLTLMAQTQPAASDQKARVKVQMRNVLYHFSDSVVVHIETLNGEVVPTGENKFPIFDDKRSFNIEISSGKIAIDIVSLANVLNSYVFASANAPLKDISVTMENGRLKIRGKLHTKGDIPFETDGVLTPTRNGRIRLHCEKIKALHVSVKGLMDLFNVQIADFVKTGKVPGVATDQNDLILDLSQILPAPHIEGKVTAIRLEGNTLVQTFGSADAKSIKYLRLGNYMSYEGNQLRFGKLTMSDADMILIDMDPGDPFDFFLDHYKEQISAGYTKITPSFGLRVYVKDFNKLHQRRRSKNAEKK